MPKIWGHWFSEEQMPSIAKELDQIGRNIEKKTKGVREWVEEVEAIRKAKGRIF